jgi:DnaJ-class molecular chaperone
MASDGNPEEVPPGTTGSGENTCRTCEGSGKVEGRDCPDCGGTGKVVTPIGGA